MKLAIGSCYKDKKKVNYMTYSQSDTNVYVKIGIWHESGWLLCCSKVTIMQIQNLFFHIILFVSPELITAMKAF